MTEQEKQDLARALRHQRVVLLRELRRLRPTPSRAALRMNVDPGDDGNSAAAGASTDDDVAVEARDHAALAEVDGALRQLDEEPERVGVCSVCRANIETERLQMVPTTHRCVRHAHLDHSE